jgi:hypothetical protein
VFDMASHPTITASNTGAEDPRSRNSSPRLDSNNNRSSDRGARVLAGTKVGERCAPAEHKLTVIGEVGT